MEEEPCHNSHVSAAPSSTAIPLDNPSSSSSCVSTSQLQAEEANHEGANEDIQNNHRNHEQPEPTIVPYWASMAFMWDDVYFCIVLLVAFWLVASVTLAVIGIYGSVNLQMGPYCSRLIQINSMLVQSIKVEQINKPKPGLMLYGFDRPPPLDVKINWTEMNNASIPAKFQKEWIFYLNKDSQLNVFYSVKSLASPLFLVIAKGRESLVEWKEDLSFPNETLYWNRISGSGSITQKISHSFTYYVAVGNMNPENVEMELNFIVNTLLYNTSSTFNRCSLDNGSCRLNLTLSASNTALLTTPGPREGISDEEWFDVNVSYEPRWIIYLAGSGVMAVLVLFALRFCNVFQTDREERAGERAPLLPSKGSSDLSTQGSSYESFSSEEEVLTMWLVENNSVEGKPVMEGETSNVDLERLCVFCFDAPRDCFFLPCGHCAACFTCGTRIVAEACSCPICRRKLKKVRRIFTV